MFDDEIDPEQFSCFVRFVRLNPQITADDPMMRRVFDAYMGGLICDAPEEVWV